MAAMAVVGAAVVVYGFMNHLLVADISQHLTDRSAPKTGIYIAWLAVNFVVFAGLFVLARRAALIPLSLLVFASLVVNYAYHRIAEATLTIDVIEWLPHELNQLGNTSAEYGGDIAIAVMQAAAAIAAFALIRIALRRSLWLGSRASHRPLSRLAVAAFLLLNGAGMVLQPPLSVVETNLFIFGVPSLFATAPEIRPVPVSPVRAPLVEKIIVVVDESVTYRTYNELIVERVRDLPVIDYGEAASTANCSAASNALLRWGVEKPQVSRPDYDPRSNPMIWNYAKTAGFKTVLIDGQSHGEMQNYISPKEYARIDEFVPAFMEHETDVRIAAMLNERLRQPGKEFIYVVKRGAHFPYDMNYPPGLAPVNASRLIEVVWDKIQSEPLARIDYVAILDSETFEPVERVDDRQVFMTVAVRFGKTRLLDNTIFNRKQ